MRLLFIFLVSFGVFSSTHSFDVQYNIHSFIYNDYPGELLEFLKDLGWSKSLLSTFERSKHFCMDLKYNATVDKWYAKFVVGNLSLLVSGIEAGKEFQETLFDGRKAKSKLTYTETGEEWKYVENVTWTSRIIGGGPLVVSHYFYYLTCCGSAEITSQVDGKRPRNYKFGYSMDCEPMD